MNSWLFKVLRALEGGAKALPPRTALALGRRGGDLWYFLDRRRRRRARRNLRAVFGPEAGAAWVRDTARAAFRHIGQVAMECLRMPGPESEAEAWQPYLEVKGREHVEQALRGGGPLLFVTGHVGNWELMGAWVSRFLCPMAAVVRPLRNPAIDAWLHRRRAGYFTELVAKGGGARRALVLLRRGTSVGFLVDQYAGRSEPMLDFLGRPAHTFFTPGTLAARCGVPVVLGYCHRTGGGFHYEGRIEAPLYPEAFVEPRDVARALMETVNAMLGAAVRARPEQWLWMHRRWR